MHTLTDETATKRADKKLPKMLSRWGCQQVKIWIFAHYSEEQQDSVIELELVQARDQVLIDIFVWRGMKVDLDDDAAISLGHEVLCALHEIRSHAGVPTPPAGVRKISAL